MKFNYASLNNHKYEMYSLVPKITEHMENECQIEDDVFCNTYRECMSKGLYDNECHAEPQRFKNHLKDIFELNEVTLDNDSYDILKSTFPDLEKVLISASSGSGSSITKYYYYLNEEGVYFEGEYDSTTQGLKIIHTEHGHILTLIKEDFEKEEERLQIESGYYRESSGGDYKNKETPKFKISDTEYDNIYIQQIGDLNLEKQNKEFVIYIIFEETKFYVLASKNNLDEIINGKISGVNLTSTIENATIFNVMLTSLISPKHKIPEEGLIFKIKDNDNYLTIHSGGDLNIIGRDAYGNPQRNNEWITFISDKLSYEADSKNEVKEEQQIEEQQIEEQQIEEQQIQEQQIQEQQIQEQQIQEQQIEEQQIEVKEEQTNEVKEEQTNEDQTNEGQTNEDQTNEGQTNEVSTTNEQSQENSVTNLETEEEEVTKKAGGVSIILVLILIILVILYYILKVRK